MKCTAPNRKWWKGPSSQSEREHIFSHLQNELAVNTRFYYELTLSEGVRVFFSEQVED